MVILGKRNVRHLLTIPGRSTEPSHGLRRPVHQEKMQEEEQDLDRPPESISSEEEAEVVTEQDAEGFVDIDQLEVKAAEKAHTAQELPNAPSLSGDRRASRRECRNDATISATSSSPINGSPANSRKRKRQLESSAPAQAERPVFTVPSSSEVLGLSQMQHGMFFGTASQKSSQQTYGKRLWDTNVNGNIHATTKKQSGSQQSAGANGRAAAEPDRPSAPAFKKLAAHSSPTSSASKQPRRLRTAPKVVDTNKHTLNPREFKRPTKRTSAEYSGSSSPLSAAPSSAGCITPPDALSSPAHIQSSSPIIQPDPTSTHCPICNSRVDPVHLQAFTRGRSLTYSLAQRFCTSHKKRDAEALAAASVCPSIEWSSFDDRLTRFHPIIEGILNGSMESRFRKELEAKIAKGDRNLLRRPDAGLLAVPTAHPHIGSNHTNGMDHAATSTVNRYSLVNDGDTQSSMAAKSYPTPQATATITAHILTHFSDHLREAATKDRVFMDIGVPGFVQSVLVREVLLLCVREDLGVGEDEALAIVGAAGAIGDPGVNEAGGAMTQADALEILHEKQGSLKYASMSGQTNGMFNGDTNGESNGITHLEEAKSPKRNKRPKPTTTPVKRRATRSRGLEEIIELSP